MVDLKQRRVLYASEGKDSDCIKKSVAYLKEKQVCIDMFPAFISDCNAHIPHASITFDKFHVVKEVNKAMDELRKLEKRGNDLLKGHKYTLLKSKLTPKLKEERDLLLEYYPRLGKGYRIKQLFTEFRDIKNKEEAEGYLAFWCDLVDESKIYPLYKSRKYYKSTLVRYHKLY